MREFEPFDVPDGTEKYIFPVACCEPPVDFFFWKYIYHFLPNHLLFINNPTKPSLKEMLGVLHEYGYKMRKIACEMNSTWMSFALIKQPQT